ncbi:hypothetical protein KRMM14A1004_46430 [Krasilnikovia sp. MM14-A1004]
MTRTIRSRRAPASLQPPMYARLLRLRHLAPSGFLCFVFLEGSAALAILLALAELVSWWGVVVLPLTVAAMVKLNDLIAGAASRTVIAPEPGGGARSARSRQSVSGRQRTGPRLRSAVAPPPADGPMVWTPPHAELPAFDDEAGSVFDEAEPAYRELGLGFDEARFDEARFDDAGQGYGYEDHEPVGEGAGLGYEHAEPEYEETGFTYGDGGMGHYSTVDLRARIDAARAAMQTAPPLEPVPREGTLHLAGALNEAPTTRLWADQLDAEQRARQSAAHHYE